MKIAITGNIACGKSKVLELLRSRLPSHFVFGSVDDVVRALYSDPSYCEALHEKFGVSDRASVSNLVFADPRKKRALELMANRFIAPHFEALLEQPNLVLEFPLLFESAEYCGHFDLTVAVLCDEGLQAERIFKRDGIAGEKLAAIRASQLSVTTKRALADITIDTGCELVELEKQVDELVRTISEYQSRTDRSMEAWLEARFMRRFNSAGLWQIVREAYSEAHRHYHVLAHPYAMFQHYDSLRQPEGRPLRKRRADASEPVVHSPLAVESFFWFHDLIYWVDSRYARNERDSAQRMFALIKQLCPWMLSIREGFYSDFALAAEMIVSSQKHQITSPYLLGNPAHKADAELALDTDLMILSQPALVVDQFDANIRREFSIYSDEEFAKGRAAALGSFLARDKIYFSKHFADREAAARANLQRLVARYQPATSI
jgi:dephospho-CoA kinase